MPAAAEADTDVPEELPAAMTTDRARVLLLATYPLHSVPGQRFRFEQYLEPLHREGFDIDVRPVLDARTLAVLQRAGAWRPKTEALARATLGRVRDLVRARRYSFAFVSREAFPAGPALVERALGTLGVPYIFDLDDAIYLPNVSEVNRVMGRFKFAGKTSSIARDATLVLAGNRHLAAWAQRHNDEVMIVPTTIDTEHYVRPERPDTARPLCIGWSGSTTTLHYLDVLAPVLRDLQRELGVRLRVIGSDDYRIAGAQVESLPWREASEIQDLAEIDIGLMPLPDNEWARGKCGLKALQYMALGIPTVMSPVGVNVEIARGGAALLAASLPQWREALTRLLGDPAERGRLARAGRERVERSYSVDAVRPLYSQAMERMLVAARPQGLSASA